MVGIYLNSQPLSYTLEESSSCPTYLFFGALKNLRLLGDDVYSYTHSLNIIWNLRKLYGPEYLIISSNSIDMEMRDEADFC